MKKDLEYVKSRLEGSFDVKYRPVMTPLGKATLVFVDDLCSTQFISQYIVVPIKEDNNEIKNINDVMEKVLDINITSLAKDIEDSILHVLSGDVIIIYDDYEEIIYCEVKGFVRRGVSIPLTESVLKGPREGFTELFVDNISLIRRRVKNSNLKFEPIYVGEDSQTVVCITYIKGIAPDKLINEVKTKVNEMQTKFILDTNYVEDKLRGKNSIFDTVGYTEKPDEVAAKLLEGRIGVLVDGTPFVITVPYFFLENFQAPDDYYLNKYFANFTRGMRWIAFFIATFLPGLYVATVTHHFNLIPSLLVFRLAVSRAGVPLPTIIEVLVMMFAFQLIKEAGLRLPQPIGGAMSIVAALILGEAAVGAGIASRITIIVVAASTLSYFLIPKVYGAISVWSIILTITSAFIGLPGLFVGICVLIARLADLDTMGYSYLFPLGSSIKHNFKDLIFRGDLNRISKNVVGGSDNEK
ncbi:MAG: spore germination protein [Clostridium sp.]